jgi:hypothetical protein
MGLRRSRDCLTSWKQPTAAAAEMTTASSLDNHSNKRCACNLQRTSPMSTSGIRRTPGACRATPKVTWHPEADYHPPK